MQASDTQLPAPTLPSRLARVAVHTLIFLVGLWVVFHAYRSGMDLRRWTYDSTNGLRHHYDIHHNLYWGIRANNEGWIDLYRNVIENPPGGPGGYMLDYVPLRLLVMKQWAAWVMPRYNPKPTHHGNIRYPVYQWKPEFEFTSPLLYFMTAMEGASAIAVFLLIRLWIRRHVRADLREGQLLRPGNASPGIWCGSLAGLIGALLLWFSPASHISSHGWPSSDIWVVPFFLWAVLFGSVNWWFASGITLGIGLMFKGQQFIAAPLFILWPLFMGKPSAAGKWIAGFVFAAAMIVSPWLLRNGETFLYDRQAIAWVVCAALAGLALMVGAWLRWRWYFRALLVVGAGLLLIWPFLFIESNRHWDVLRFGLLLVLIAAATTWFTRPLRHLYLTAFFIGTTIALCPLLFATDLSWWKIGFEYGAEKHPGLAQFNFNTFAYTLGARFGWRNLTDVFYTIEPGAFWRWPTEAVEIPLKLALVSLYGAALTICAIGMARHTLHSDRRFLAAAAAVWLAAFAFMPQMHARYLIIPACTGALLVGVGVGYMLLDLILIFMGWGMVLMLTTKNGPGPRPYLGDWSDLTLQFFYRTNPDLAWPIILITLILLYTAVAPSRKSGREPIWRRTSRWVRSIPAKLRRRVQPTPPETESANPELASAAM